MGVRRIQISATGATGGSGTATATARSSHIVNGVVMAVYLAYLDSPPAGTTDVVIDEAHNNPPVTVLSVSNAATTGWFQPLAQAEDTAGASFSGQGMMVPVNDYLDVTISQANDGDGVTATIVYME